AAVVFAWSTPPRLSSTHALTHSLTGPLNKQLAVAGSATFFLSLSPSVLLLLLLLGFVPFPPVPVALLLRLLPFLPVVFVDRHIGSRWQWNHSYTGLSSGLPPYSWPLPVCE